MLDAVAELVEEVGLRDLSLREVARRAGVSHATPGHHFGDKEGMLAAFAQRGFEMFADAFSARGEGMLDGRAYVEFALEHRPYFDVMFRSGLDKSRYPGLAESAGTTFSALAEAVGKMQENGMATTAPKEIVALRLWSLVHGLASLLVDHQLDDVVSDENVSEIVEAVLSADG